MTRKIKAIPLIFAGALLLSNSAYADNSALECVSTKWDGDNYVFTNNCDYNIYVMYCGTTKKITGKLCGDYSGSTKGRGTYYTHTFNLKAGKSKDKWKPGKLNYGACKGMTGFGKSFSDTEDGSFSCDEPKRMYD